MPRTSFATLIALLVVGISACTPTSPTSAPTTARSSPPTLPTVPFAPSTTSKAPATPEADDYRGLLLSAADLSDAEDTFTERSKESRPNGDEGATAFFVNDKDNRAVSDTFLVYPDAATATATLKQAAGTLPTLVAGGAPQPFAVGTDGVVISGSVPNEDKAVTLVFFAQDRALVRLEFQSAAGDATTDQFVTNVAKMQQIALRIGLAEAQ